MKKYISSILILFFLLNIYQDVYAKEESADFKAHKERVSEICKANQFSWLVSIVKTLEDYKEADESTWSTDAFTNAKKIYRENMNNIYKCALLKIQREWINKVNKELQWKIDKTGDIAKNIEQKTKTETEKLGIKMNSLCNNSNNWTGSVAKTEVLKNASQETCKYVSYLEYLKRYYQNTASLVALTNTWWLINDTLNKINNTNSINWLNQTYNNLLNDIDTEENNAYSIFPIAFQSYLQYETNYVAHRLLELLRETYIVFREKLNSVVNPINQLVYKISNAMKK